MAAVSKPSDSKSMTTPLSAHPYPWSTSLSKCMMVSATRVMFKENAQDSPLPLLNHPTAIDKQIHLVSLRKS